LGNSSGNFGEELIGGEVYVIVPDTGMIEHTTPVRKGTRAASIKMTAKSAGVSSDENNNNNTGFQSGPKKMKFVFFEQLEDGM
jgi:hypothetical protein